MSCWLISPSIMATRIINSHPTTCLSSPCNPTALISTSSRTRRRLLPCKAAPPWSSSITEFDLYELLGIPSSSGHAEIKKAYRSLQKQCHPDIAGAVGHDMAIILNEAYALLSDPISRSAYDKEQAMMAEMRGYTGSPVYSAWFGPENEQRAVFVDEVKCVGCLKCALIASKTFAIESVYGRARVVAQWADPELLIEEAVDACPVNCISTVERSDLPALEFIMSKLPRGSVGIGSGNTVGVRVTDVFTEAKLFLRKLESKNNGNSTASDLQRDRRMSAVHAILSISSWLFQRPLNGSSSAGEALIRIGLRSRIDKLKMAAAARRLGKPGLASYTTPCHLYGGEYWVPVLAPPQGAPSKAASTSTSTSTMKSYRDRIQSISDEEMRYDRQWPLVWGIPVGASAIGAITVELQGGGGGGGGLTEHVGGALALHIVNSRWLQVALAGATWYIAGLTIVLTIQALGRRETMNK